MAPPFSARRPIPGIQPFFERRREITPPCVSSHYPRPRLAQLRGGIYSRSYRLSRGFGQAVRRPQAQFKSDGLNLWRFILVQT